MTSPAYQHPSELGPKAWEEPLEPPRAGEPPHLWLGRRARLKAEAAQLSDTVLDGGEKARAAAFARTGDRDTYLVAHVGLRMLLGAYLDTKPSDVPLCRDSAETGPADRVRRRLASG